MFSDVWVHICGVLCGTTISEVAVFGFWVLCMDCLSWRLSSTSPVVRVRHTSQGMAVTEVSNMAQGCEPSCSPVIQCFLTLRAIFRNVHLAHGGAVVC